MPSLKDQLRAQLIELGVPALPKNATLADLRRAINESTKPPVTNALIRLAKASYEQGHRHATDRYSRQRDRRIPTIVAIDPGDTHVGMAYFNAKTKPGEVACYSAFEVRPGECIDLIRGWLQGPHLVALVVEEFRLYPWQSESQAWSEFKTVELIGVLKYLHAEHGGIVSREGERLRDREVVLEMQPASIKKPTGAQLKARKIASVAKRESAGGHAKDAELHGYYYVLRRLERGR